MLTATFLTDLWFDLCPCTHVLLRLTRPLRFGAVAIRLAVAVFVSLAASSVFPDISKEDKND